MQELRMKDLYIGKVVTSDQIQKFHNYVIVLGHITKEYMEGHRPIATGKIVFIGKTLGDFIYNREEGEDIYIKTLSLGTINKVEVNKEEEVEYEQLFSNPNGTKSI